MFDFDGNGHTDCGEQFIGYQIFRDVTEPFAGGGCGGRSGGNAGSGKAARGSSPEEAPSGQKPACRRLRGGHGWLDDFWHHCAGICDPGRNLQMNL